MNSVRRAGTASAAVLCGLVLAIGLGRAAAPEWTRWSGLDLWNVAELRAALRATDEDRVKLQSEEELLFRQIEAVDHLAARLATGAVTLAEAAVECEPLVRDRPGFAKTVPLHFKTPNLRHAIYRYLIYRVGRTLESEPARCAIAMERLETEYRALQ